MHNAIVILQANPARAQNLASNSKSVSQAVFIDCGIEYIGSDLMTDLGQERQKLIRQPSGEDRDSANRVTIKSRHAGQKKKKLGSSQRSGGKLPVERP